MITKEQYVKRALGYVGMIEGTTKHKEIVKAYNAIRPLPSGYSLKASDAWCAAFVSAVANLAGYGDSFPYECSVSRMVDKAKRAKMYIDKKDTTPRVGWLVVYDWQGDGRLDHVGIVSEVLPKTIKVIEGNYNDRVKIRTIKQDAASIVGYIPLKFAISDNPSNLEIAREVIAGRWGNGEQRRKALKKAGYDPEAIQKLVNKLLK